MPGGYMGGPTAGQFGMMSMTQPTAAEQDAFTKRNIARAEYGRAWQSGGFPRYSGGIAQRLVEEKRNKEAMEARRNEWQDSLKERETRVKEAELEEKRKQGEWERKGGALGGAGQETPSARPASGTPHSASQVASTSPTQTAPATPIVPPAPATPQIAGGGTITVPEESAQNDPRLKAGTFRMDAQGKTQRIYGEPKPSLGDDPFAYTPGVPRPKAASPAFGMKGQPMGPTGGAGGSFDATAPNPAKKKREELLQSIGQGGANIGTYIGSGLAKGTIWGDLGRYAREALKKLSPYTLY